MANEENLKEKYKRRMKTELESSLSSHSTRSSPSSKQESSVNIDSKEYKSFLQEFKEMPRGVYEKSCALAEKYAGISPDPKSAETMQVAINFARLQLTPKGVYSFGILAPIFALLLFSVLSLLLFKSSGFLIFLIVIGSLGAIKPLLNMPYFLADNFRLKASNQMVLAVFYLVTYMRHTSNLERAVEFASNHLTEPLSFEFKKILWDVETGTYGSISESIENFLEEWKEHNPEFVDAIHLIEGSLLEGSEKRRVDMLEKSLDVILDETYEKMLHFAHNLQSPITTLHMLGIILPILGLVILPLMLSFLEEVKWYHISVLYNVFLPILVYLMGLRILSKRPTGYGQTALNENNPEIQKALHSTMKIGKYDLKIKPKTFLIFFVVIFVTLGFSPLIMHAVGSSDFGFGDENLHSACGKQFCFLEYREEAAGVGTAFKEVGPYGLGASVISLFVIIGIGAGFGLFYSARSRELKKIFDKSNALENEFSSALFQLGNRLGDNLPAEIAMLKVAQTLPDTSSGQFFRIVSVNIQKLGMSVQDSIFNRNVGALVYYPSSLIESSMKVLIQAVKKGPLIASNALINISRYVKEMHKVEERLQDLMAEVISSMKSQIKFLTPIIAAIVVGITSMIGAIIGTLSSSLGELTDATAGGSTQQLSLVTEFFKSTMPTFYFQLIVGLYVLQITFILTILVNTIQNGSDNVHRDFSLGQNLKNSALLYSILTAAVMIGFNIVTANILPAGG
jgi:hypothetical protein